MPGAGRSAAVDALESHVISAGGLPERWGSGGDDGSVTTATVC